MLHSRQQLVEGFLLYIDNLILNRENMPPQIGGGMMSKINRCVTIGGQKFWIRANTEQEYAEKLMEHCGGAGRTPAQGPGHPFGEYAKRWFETYARPNIETVTATTYQRQLDRYLIPHFRGKTLEEITVSDIQKLFNSMDGAKATKTKAKNVLNMILESAVDDEILSKNPLSSRRIRITGGESKPTKTYSVEQMRYLVQHLDDVQQPMDRAYLALQAMHPLRLEEVLGLKWGDIDLEQKVLHIRRAVTHPTRNLPEVKVPKTAASLRDLSLSDIAARYLTPGKPEEYVIGGERPLSYTQVRRMCGRIKKDTGFFENVTPIRFRTTVLTDIYEQTHDIKQAQAAAGHTSSAMTLRHYVKGRGTARETAEAIDRAYGT